MKDAGAYCAAAASHLPPRLRASTVAARAGDPSGLWGNSRGLPHVVTYLRAVRFNPRQVFAAWPRPGLRATYSRNSPGEELTMTALHSYVSGAWVDPPASRRSRFPAGHPGREPLAVPERRGGPPRRCTVLTRQLNRHGIRLRAGRAAVLIDLAGRLPPAVLAHLLGMHPATRGSLEDSHSSPSSFSRPSLAACTSAGSDR